MRGALLVLTLVAAACGSPEPEPAPVTPTPEADLRTRLGVPTDAERVVIFAQNAHLDIDWQKTFDDYYASYVGDIFLEARAILDQQPRAHYSVAEMAFLKRHVEAHPEELAALRAHIARGALHIVGGGMTSPDTLLPETELLMRDMLYGARFAEDVVGAAPARSAWLPDSFGHSPTTPDLLAAAGYTAVAFSRSDGAPTILEALQDPDRPAAPGSNAELLAQLGSADFVWRGPGGAEVLAHWMPTSGLYCQGDSIDYDEPIAVPGGHIGTYHGDDPPFVDAAIDRYVAELTPFAKTPYLFVPVGCDFQHPKAELLAYLDAYNARRFPETKVWVVAASFDEYAALVRTHQGELPVLDADLEPYFMGFYATRAAIKREVRAAARPFFAAEVLAVALGKPAPLSAELELLARADHHDFIPGTSTDDVAGKEQLPLLAAAKAAAESALGTGPVLLNPASTAQRGVPPFGWRSGAPEAGAMLDLCGPDLCWTKPGVFEVIEYADMGGLWRLGHEMKGCSLTPIPSNPCGDDGVWVEDSPTVRRLRFTGPAATCEVWTEAGMEGVGFAIETGAAEGTTRTVRLHLGQPGPQRTSLAGGWAERPVERVYSPTFWPAVEWASVGTSAVLLRQSTGVRFDGQGGIELMAVRDARSEKCDFEGGEGSDTATHRIEWRIVRAEPPLGAARAAQRFNRPLVAVAGLSGEGSLLTAEGEGLVTAVKPAERGEGVIVRALLSPGPLTLHLGPGLSGRTATRCDAAERDLAPLGAAAQTLVLDKATFGAIATVRLR